MPIDINLLREDKGGNPELVRESQRKRNGKPELVDAVIDLDRRWRTSKFEADQKKRLYKVLLKDIGELKKNKQPADELLAQKQPMETEIEAMTAATAALEAERDVKLKLIGNLVHDSVPVSNNEEHNRVESVWGECVSENKTLHHHELLEMIDGYEAERGSRVAGHRAYFLKGMGVLLNQALINYGLSFLMSRKYTPLQPPFFMNKDVMAETAQLEEFDESLYKVIGTREEKSDAKDDNAAERDEEKYLIATSEQPISALHRKETLDPKELPIRYAGFSTCFRKEAGSYGRDAWGIFRVHQFEKVEQFCITSPEESWAMQDEMIACAGEFYQSLGLSYRVINIVSGALNNAAARKLDLEAWFPALGLYRELVSCSNCLDYQSRAMETYYGFAKAAEHEARPFVHMLNATLTATERTICCILENYQTSGGVVVPPVLRPFMGGIELMPFRKEKPVNKNKEKQAKAAAKAEKAQAAQAAPAAQE